MVAYDQQTSVTRKMQESTVQDESRQSPAKISRGDAAESNLYNTMNTMSLDKAASPSRKADADGGTIHSSAEHVAIPSPRMGAVRVSPNRNLISGQVTIPVQDVIQTD